MGDRGNIIIKDQGSGGEVFLYSHWGGFELPETLGRGLKRGRARWDDGPYLARIIFSTMTKGNEDGETGFGIATSAPDNEYPLLVVDVGAGAVVVRDARTGEETQSIPMSEYVGQDWGWDDDRRLVGNAP